MPTLKNKFACLTDLPSMPVLLMEALQQINGKQDLTTLVDKISQDPSMAVQILRIANSSFYGMSREIGSLREAVVLLGFNRIRDLLISICFSKMLPERHKDFNYRQFWHHSMAVAECTRQLAGLSGNSPDFAFTAGLLHDIGDLVIVMLFPDEFSRLVKVSAKFGIEEEQKILGFNHTTIGGKAAQYWNLPQEIQEAIEQHETYPESATTKSLGLLVYTANLLIVNTEQSDKSALEEHEPICTALAILNISIDQAAHCTDSGRQFANQILTLY
ncbi:MAG: HDOD domain-containing protein [Methylobacter sp.]|nr:HDOD domain-containing protein [Methylobacter sp.]